VIRIKAHWLVFAFALTTAAHADGLPLTDGRYDGPSLILKLTQQQKRVIDHFRTCHLENFKTMNQYTPYIFKLTPNQEMRLRAKVGFSPSSFAVYETYRGDNDAGPHWNLALRFSEDQIEIPLDIVVSNGKANEEHAMQGWKNNNPCFPAFRR